MKTLPKSKFNKYDLIEITWLDSHSRSGWNTPTEVNEWIERAKSSFVIKTVGYFIQEDDKFIRICQSHDHQSENDGSEGDNCDALFAVAKSCILNIKIKS